MSDVDIQLPHSVVFNEVDYEPGGSFGPRVQQDVQLVILDRGSLCVTTDGREQVVEPGRVVCQWPGGTELYRFDDQRVSTHRWVALSFDDSPRTLRWIAQQRKATPAIGVETPAMRKLFDTGIALNEPADPAQHAARLHLAVAYLQAFSISGNTSRVSAHTAQRAALPPALLAIQRTIQTRYAEPLSLDDLASAAAQSTNHLVRLCRKHLDTTPMRMLWDCRVDHGVELLRSTGLHVGEIAYRVGFANPFHFSRRCKEKYGVSPRKLRQDAWGP
ncbi:MAG: helix-turn-helix transcriptional regulator [Planctomycetota bacterium]